MDKKDILKKVDHTLLGQTATWDDIRGILDDAMKYEAASACIPAAYVKQAAEYVAGKLPICTVIGFPLGATTTASKVFEAQQAVRDGADELDMVINIGELKAKHDDKVMADIRAVADEVHRAHRILKVIIETALLTDEEKVRACQLTIAGQADFVKTSTGFSTSGAQVTDVELMRQTVGDAIKIKAAGGIHSYDEAMAMIDAGADRLGVSASVKILNEASE